MRWEHALVACLVCTTFVFVSTTNLSYNTLGAGLLVIGMALGARAVVSRGRDRWLAAAGVAQALAALAYPTLVLALPVTAACLACSTAGPPAAGAARLGSRRGATLVAEALLLASFGVSNVLRCLHYQLTGWHMVNGASGAAKLWDVAAGVARHLELFPLVVVAALAVWLAYRRWPAARLALVLTPLALLPFGEQLVSGADGFGVIYGLAAPYFYLFVPIERRALATRLLVWGYLPALAAGLVSGVLERQRLAADGRRPSAGDGPERGVPGARPGAARGRGRAPAQGAARRDPRLPGRHSRRDGRLSVPVPAARGALLADDGDPARAAPTPASAPLRSAPPTSSELRADLARVATPSDRLLVFYQVPAFYLFWPHRIAANSVWIASTKGLTDDGRSGPLPPATLAYYEREHTLPDVVVRVINTAGLSARELEQHYCGGLDYRLVLVRPQYAVFRRPAGVTSLAGVSQSGR